MALTPMSWPHFCGSVGCPLYRKTVLRAVTERLGNCERLLIRLSVIPSLRYSVLGSLLAFEKGKTAIESIRPCDEPCNTRSRRWPTFRLNKTNARARAPDQAK